MIRLLYLLFQGPKGVMGVKGELGEQGAMGEEGQEGERVCSHCCNALPAPTISRCAI